MGKPGGELSNAYCCLFFARGCCPYGYVSHRPPGVGSMLIDAFSWRAGLSAHTFTGCRCQQPNFQTPPWIVLVGRSSAITETIWQVTVFLSSTTGRWRLTFPTTFCFGIHSGRRWIIYPTEQDRLCWKDRADKEYGGNSGKALFGVGGN